MASMWDYAKRVGGAMGAAVPRPNALMQAGDALVPGESLAKGLSRTNNEYRDVDPGGQLAGEAGMASGLADAATANQFGARARQTGLADALEAETRRLRRRAEGEDSFSREMLRQGLQNRVAAMRSMAAGASPANAPMAARTAMIQGGRAMGGLAGQQALAGIRERQMAEQALGAHLQARGSQLQGMRGQDLHAALESRGQALGGYGDIERARSARFAALAGAPTPTELWLSGLMGGAATYATGRGR